MVLTRGGWQDGQRGGYVDVGAVGEEVLAYELRKELVGDICAVMREDLDLAAKDEDVAFDRVEEVFAETRRKNKNKTKGLPEHELTNGDKGTWPWEWSVSGNKGQDQGH